MAPMTGRPGGWERGAGVASLVAALVHGGLTPGHFEQWWGYGAFFLVTGAAQAVLGLALALDAFDGDPRMRRLLWLAGAAGNALVVATYLASRTAGVPFAGPEAGEVEPWDALGVATTLAEALVVGVLVGLLARAGRPAPQPGPAS